MSWASTARPGPRRLERPSRDSAGPTSDARWRPRRTTQRANKGVVVEKLDKLLYTVDEVAEMLSVSKMTIYRLFGTGELDSVKIGKSRRIPREAVVKFLESLEP